jgi:hypothetical protein
MTETEARERALQVFRQHNRIVGSLDLHTGEVDLSRCEDSELMRSYRSDRGEGRWLFKPVISGLARDPNLAAAYSTYVVFDDGDVQRVRYTADPDGVTS